MQGAILYFCKYAFEQGFYNKAICLGQNYDTVDSNCMSIFACKMRVSKQSVLAAVILFLIIAIVMVVFTLNAQNTPIDSKTYRKATVSKIIASTVPISTSTTTSTLPAPTTTKSMPVAVKQENKAVSDDIWERLRNCESGSAGLYLANTGNGYYGAYQFSATTWRSMGTAYAFAHEAPPEVQDDAARRLQARSGWGQWPACSRKLGLI